MSDEQEWVEIECNLKLNQETFAMLERFKEEWGYRSASVVVERILKELLTQDT
jgi:hypothetical protein